MPTFSQLISNTRRQKKKRRGYRGLQRCPQRRGVCARVYVRLVYTRNGKTKSILPRRTLFVIPKFKSLIRPKGDEIYGFFWCKSNHMRNEKQFLNGHQAMERGIMQNEKA